MAIKLFKLLDLFRGFLYINALKWVFGQKVKAAPLAMFGRGVSIRVAKGGSVVLGRRLVVRQGCYISSSGGDVIVGDSVFFNCGCVLTSRDLIEIGDGVTFGPNVVIVDHDHDFRSPVQAGNHGASFVNGAISIGDGAWIGANVVVLRGTVIGRRSVIAAGSIVKGVVPDDAVYCSSREYVVKEIVRG